MMDVDQIHASLLELKAYHADNLRRIEAAIAALGATPSDVQIPPVKPVVPKIENKPSTDSHAGSIRAWVLREFEGYQGNFTVHTVLRTAKDRGPVLQQTYASMILKTLAEENRIRVVSAGGYKQPTVYAAVSPTQSESIPVHAREVLPRSNHASEVINDHVIARLPEGDGEPVADTFLDRGNESALVA